MSDVIDLKKKFNHRWKRDPKFIEGFNYEKPEYADTPDSLRWALPIHECLEKPEVKEQSKRLREESKRRVAKKSANAQRLKLIKE